VEPSGALEGLSPIDGPWFGQRNGAVLTVVNNFRRALVGSGLDEINAHASPATNDARRVHAESAQLTQERVRDGIVGRQDSDISGGVP
jgi:hypothetical protein